MKKAIVYLHSDKLSMRELGEEIGLAGEALKNFMYACYEVRLDLDVDDSGESVITAVDGRQLAPAVKP